MRHSNDNFSCVLSFNLKAEPYEMGTLVPMLQMKILRWKRVSNLPKITEGRMRGDHVSCLNLLLSFNLGISFELKLIRL